jgi:hypothetical protein
VCPFLAASIEIADPEHPARQRAHEYKESFAARLTAVAREGGAADPELLGAQLALLFDGASAQTRVLGVDTIGVAVGVAAMLIDQAMP